MMRERCAPNIDHEGLHTFHTEVAYLLPDTGVSIDPMAPMSKNSNFLLHLCRTDSGCPFSVCIPRLISLNNYNLKTSGVQIFVAEAERALRGKLPRYSWCDPTVSVSINVHSTCHYIARTRPVLFQEVEITLHPQVWISTTSFNKLY